MISAEAVPKAVITVAEAAISAAISVAVSAVFTPVNANANMPVPPFLHSKNHVEYPSDRLTDLFKKVEYHIITSLIITTGV